MVKGITPRANRCHPPAQSHQASPRASRTATPRSARWGRCAEVSSEHAGRSDGREDRGYGSGCHRRLHRSALGTAVAAVTFVARALVVRVTIITAELREATSLATPRMAEIPLTRPLPASKVAWVLMTTYAVIPAHFPTWPARRRTSSRGCSSSCSWRWRMRRPLSRCTWGSTGRGRL